MNGIRQFLAYNLFPSLLAGGLVLFLVLVGMRLGRITHGPLRLCLLSAPLIKSTLVLAGIQPVIGWSVFTDEWRALAVPSAVVLPALGGALGVALIGHRWWRGRDRHRLMFGAVSTGPAVDRLAQAAERVLHAYRAPTGDAACVGSGPRPTFVVTDQPVDSPLVLMTSAPTVIFPRALVDEFDDEELDAAVAHEIAHVRLRQPPWCSTAGARFLTAINPFALAIAAHWHLEEEKACDQMAVTTLGRPHAYAAMLLKAFRYARRQSLRPAVAAVGARVVGRRPLLTERVTHVLADARPGVQASSQFVGAAIIWCAIVVGFMSA